MIALLCIILCCVFASSLRIRIASATTSIQASMTTLSAAGATTSTSSGSGSGSPLHHSPLLQRSRLAQTELPPPIISNVPGTWAFDTMSRRIANEIFPRLVKDNEKELSFPSSPLRSECLFVLNDLLASIESGKYGYLRGISDKGPDLREWDTILASIPEDDRNWLDAPWVISEFYLYRRVIEAFRFFETGYDMFLVQKVKGLVEAMPTIADISSRIPSLLAADDKAAAIAVAIQTSLWGNKMDLSLWPATDTAATSNGNSDSDSSAAAAGNAAGRISYGSALQATEKYILEDRTKDVVKWILDNQNQGADLEIGIIVDNAGYELFSDLLLGHILLELGVVKRVTFHTKAHPTFVSDATTRDVTETVDFLSHDDCSAAIGKAFAAHLQDGSFQCVDDLFWCQPTAMWDMPTRVIDRLSNSLLVFVKGDANYRRLLGDRHWPLSTASQDVLSYWPVPVCPLRTFKAEIGCGITHEKEIYAAEQDEQWMVSGRWGVVQFANPIADQC